MKAAIGEVIDSDVRAVVSSGRSCGHPGIDSDIDLAVIAASARDKRAELKDTVRTRVGYECDVLLFTESEFRQGAAEGEQVVSETLRDGIALAGTKPRAVPGAA